MSVYCPLCWCCGCNGVYPRGGVGDMGDNDMFEWDVCVHGVDGVACIIEMGGVGDGSCAA